jgi:channel protein (hemolysin III family)
MPSRIGHERGRALRADSEAGKPATVTLRVAGSFLYSAGVGFQCGGRLRFQNAIWHGFVLVAAACHYAALLDCVAFARTAVWYW